MTTEEVLAKAADLIEERGLARGFLQGDDGTLCIMGALSYATMKEVNSSVYQAAKTVVAQELGFPGAIGRVASIRLADWNDAPGRTKEEVATTLRNAKRWL